MTKVLVSDPIDQAGIDILGQVAQVDQRVGLSETELKEIIKDYDALMIRSGTQVNADVIEASEKLRIIGRAGVGVDNVDVKEIEDTHTETILQLIDKQMELEQNIINVDAKYNLKFKNLGGCQSKVQT